MAKAKHSSAIGPFGAVVIALGIFLGFIHSSIYIAACGIAAGIFILLIGCLADRLDTIIDLLRQLNERQASQPEGGEEPQAPAKEP